MPFLSTAAGEGGTVRATWLLWIVGAEGFAYGIIVRTLLADSFALRLFLFE
jgi:hypothetical protein